MVGGTIIFLWLGPLKASFRPCKAEESKWRLGAQMMIPGEEGRVGQGEQSEGAQYWMFECVLGDMPTGTVWQAADTVHLEQFPAAFPFSCSPLSIPSLTLPALPLCFRDPVMLPREAMTSAPGLALWPFPMLLSPRLRLPHLLREQAHSMLSLDPPSLPRRLYMPLPRTTNTHTHTHTRTHTQT